MATEAIGAGPLVTSHNVYYQFLPYDYSPR